MSNARSPREVCSTTMGTSGLMLLALVCLRRADSFPRLAARRGIVGGPQPPGDRRRGGLCAALALGRPQLLPRVRLRDRDRTRALRELGQRAARRLLLAQLVDA